MADVFVSRGVQHANPVSLFPSFSERWAGDDAAHERAKRLFDVSVCLILLPWALIALGICAIFIQLETPGRLLAVQLCAGRGGRRFQMYGLWTQRAFGDSRATRVGLILRRTGLAGLPKIFNVLGGTMSLVGPPATLHGSAASRLWHTARFDGKPGIVSPSQVAHRSDLDFEERLRLDLWHIRYGSVALDAKVLLDALAVAGRRRRSPTSAARDLAIVGNGESHRVTDAAAPVDATAQPTSQRAFHHARSVPRSIGRYWVVRSGLLVLFDCTVILAAFILSYYVRFELRIATDGAPLSTAPLPEYVKSASILASAWLYGMWREGLYAQGLRSVAAPPVRLGAIVTSGAYALAVLMAISFMYRDLLLSRQVYLIGGMLAVAGVSAVRAAFCVFDRRVSARGDTVARVAIVGTSASAREFADRLHREMPSVEVVGFVTESDSSDGDGDGVLGNVRDIMRIHEQLRFDTLVLASARLAADAMEAGSEKECESGVSLVNCCEEHGIALYMLSGSFSVAVTPQEVASVSGMPLVHLKDASLHPLYALLKRGADVTAAAVILLLGLPAWLLVATLVKCSSRGPLFFTQWRAGQNGRPFRMYKFRSMTVDAEARLANLIDLTSLKEPVFKLKNDPRVTSIGRWMRRTGIDEIPQLINVLKGEMSIVGPRPEESRIVEQYSAWQRRRLKAKPGITGYQQIKNRGGTSLAERVKYDLVYLKHQSFLLDLYILYRTPIVLIRGSGITH